MDQLIKGKGAQINPANKFDRAHVVTDFIEGIDEELLDGRIETQVFFEHPNKVVNRVDSPDLPFNYSINPYQGCEHGCVYCYARDTHQYWGFSSGLDFESKIIVKKEAAVLLERKLLSDQWKPEPIMISGNTDCYQPLERKYRITRSLLEVFDKYQNPVGLITKNSLISRDQDILKSLASNRLVKVLFSITTMDENLRRMMEPRTASIDNKLKTIEKLAYAGIPVGVMVAPVIPGINHQEIPRIMKAAAGAGASFASYNVLRLNGNIKLIFRDWLMKYFPDRVHKVWNLVSAMHNGEVGDSTWTRRLMGSGNISDVIRQLFDISRKQYFNDEPITYNLSAFRQRGNYKLF